MKIFVYKSLFVLICVYVLYEFTIGYKIRQFETQFNNIYSKKNIIILKEKIKDEMRSAIKKEVYLNPEDAKLIGEFIDKVQKELNMNKTQ